MAAAMCAARSELARGPDPSVGAIIAVTLEFWSLMSGQTGGVGCKQALRSTPRVVAL